MRVKSHVRSCGERQQEVDGSAIQVQRCHRAAGPFAITGASQRRVRGVGPAFRGAAALSSTGVASCDPNSRVSEILGKKVGSFVVKIRIDIIDVNYGTAMSPQMNKCSPTACANF